jgi:DNA-binding NarL/FixJ family response regulator
VTRIFCIDDDPVIRSFVTSRLKIETDLELVGVAKDGEAALRMLDGEKVDVLLCDYNLPDMNGFEIIDAVRERDAGPPPAALFCTSWADEDFETMAYEMGACGVISKRDLSRHLVPALRSVASGGIWFSSE